MFHQNDPWMQVMDECLFSEVWYKCISAKKCMSLCTGYLYCFAHMKVEETFVQWKLFWPSRSHSDVPSAFSVSSFQRVFRGLLLEPLTLQRENHLSVWGVCTSQVLLAHTSLRLTCLSNLSDASVINDWYKYHSVVQGSEFVQIKGYSPS